MVLTCKNIVVVMAVLGVAVSQLSEHPYAQTGTNYRTDLASRQEHVDDQGTVQGQYSYVDPTGHRVTVKYTAGKNGYQVINEPQPAPLVSFPSQNLHHHSLASSVDHTAALFQSQISQQPLDTSVHQSNINVQYPSQYQNQQYAPKSFQGAYLPRYTQSYRGPPLFTPSNNPYPAATAGQVKSYQDALAEEAMELAKQNQQGFAGNQLGYNSPAKSHVDVKNENQGYSYNINL